MYKDSQNKKIIVDYLKSKNVSDAQMLTMFVNRVGTASFDNSLRLTKIGVQVLEEHFPSYVIKVKQPFSVKAIHIHNLEREMLLPYYIDNKKIVVFNEKDAVDLKLIDGDVELWSRNFSINNQDYSPKFD
tara:strand:- start:51 stop:440 length:390 start_codon:yes stop_codon:yes gene_type:complete